MGGGDGISAATRRSSTTRCPTFSGTSFSAASRTRAGLFVALTLLAFGSGAIKPNTSVLLGQIYDAEKKEALLNEGFSLYYAAVNVGAA